HARRPARDPPRRPARDRRRGSRPTGLAARPRRAFPTTPLHVRGRRPARAHPGRSAVHRLPGSPRAPVRAGAATPGRGGPAQPVHHPRGVSRLRAAARVPTGRLARSAAAGLRRTGQHEARPTGRWTGPGVTWSGARDLAHLVGGDEVLDLDVVEGPQVDTALEALADLGDVVLEPPQAGDLQTLGDDDA